MSGSPQRLREDFERIVALVLVSLLAFAVFLILSPFLGAIAWAAVLAVTVRPGYVALREALGNRPRLAALAVSLALGAALIAPLAVLVGSLTDNVRDVADIAHDLTEAGTLPGPPQWIAGVPLAGRYVDAAWKKAAADSAGLLDSLRPRIESGAAWILGQGARLSLAVLEFLLAVGITGVLCVHGEAAAEVAARAASRLGGPGAPALLATAASTVRGVAAGVIGTAIIQALLSAIGFWLAGIPGVPLLAMLCFVIALAQVGTGLVWIPAAIWLGYKGATAALVFTIVWNLGVNVSDNVIKPWLIGRGSPLPLAVIFLGVLGGLLAWGFLGMFLGATLLAVAYELFRDWVEEQPAGPDPR
ncbi:MAG: AI-2E family transporter [Deltaproteobacteria bacterium]|nr:AI-2E family transporter [Deltaproteobacteria bacterium]